MVDADLAAGHDEARDAAWIAEVDGNRVGCVFVVPDDRAGPEATAELGIGQTYALDLRPSSGFSPQNAA